MQNKIKQVMKSKGYYIVLFLCLIAVGISGYLYYRGSDDTNLEASKPLQLQTQQNSLPTVKPTEKKADKQADSHEVLSEKTEKIKQASEKPTTPTLQKLKVSMPLEGDTQRGYAMDHLAYNETMRDWRTHAGMDIAAAAGESVHAAADGVVFAVYDDDATGKTVVLSHNGSYQTYYGNLAEEVLVKVGDQVSVGDVIGTVGNTAMTELAQKPHLHFAVTCSGAAMDPVELLNS